MGGLVGGVVSSVIGGKAQSKASKKAAAANAQAQAENRAVATQTQTDNRAYAEKTQADNRTIAMQMYDKGVALVQPEIVSGDQASNYINGMLGLSDSTAADNAFTQYRDTSGYKYLVDEAMNGVNANAAARGSFQSGDTAKRLQERAMSLADTTRSDYLNQLASVANRGGNAKTSVINQGSSLTNNIIGSNNSLATAVIGANNAQATALTAANNSQSQSAQQNALNQGAIKAATFDNINSSFDKAGSIFGKIFG